MEIEHPFFSQSQEVLDCVEKVTEYVLKQLDKVQFVDVHELIHHIDIPIEIHSLLADTYNEKWSEQSRFTVFEVIRLVFLSYIKDRQNEIEIRLGRVLPENMSVRVTDFEFVDEPQVDVVVQSGVTDIINNTKSLTDEKKYTFSGNSITVDVIFEIQEKDDDGTLRDPLGFDLQSGELFDKY